MRVTRKFRWSSAHRLLGHPKCGTLHGHDYVATVELRSKFTDDMVMDYGEIQRRIGTFIDEKWDHTTLVWAQDLDLMLFCKGQVEKNGHKESYVMGSLPTAENIAKELYRQLIEMFPERNIEVSSVIVAETTNTSAIYIAEEES